MYCLVCISVTGDSDSLLLQEYIKKFTPVYPENSGRIVMLKTGKGTPNAGHSIHDAYMSLLVTSVIMISCVIS